ncbi:MAG: right-handed parallel beta-helix repeat-containing protein [bacterium]
MWNIRAMGLLVLLQSATALKAATIDVPDDFETVLAGLDAAATGDTVRVGPGLWQAQESRVVPWNGGSQLLRSNGYLKPGVTLIGAGSDLTVIEALPEEPMMLHGILTLASSGAGVRVEGVTLRGSGFLFNGIMASASLSFELVDCAVEHCMFGVTSSFTNLIVRGCTFRDNDASEAGGDPSGIYSTYGTWRIEDTLFVGNRNGVLFNSAGEIALTFIQRCRFQDNSGGSLVLLRSQDPLVIEDCWFEGNEVINSAIHLSGCDGQVRRNVFYDNVGPAFYTIGSTSEFVENTLWMNTVNPAGSSYSGAYLVADVGIPVVFARNVIAGCRGGPAVRVYGGYIGYHVDSSCNLFFDNDLPQFRDYIVAPTDVFADPLFCNPSLGDFTVAKNSPCVVDLPLGCGPIGAFGVGCEAVSVEPTSWGKIKGLYRTEE